MSRIQVIYSGKVQGVGFRWKVLQIAKKYAVSGYVQNLNNGKVELLVEGKDSQVGKMVEEVDTELKNYWYSQEREWKHSEPHFKEFSSKEY
jgi:acylphosphatase